MSQVEWKIAPVKVAVLTVSDPRTEETDKGGKLVQEYVLQSGHGVKEAIICKDDFLEIQRVIKKWSEEDIDIIIITGGTGIAQRDVTIEAVQPLCNKVIPGFGELFRYLSYAEDIGVRAMASRAMAGTLGNKLIYTIPGSMGAIRLGMEKLILPEMLHLLQEIRK